MALLLRQRLPWRHFYHELFFFCTFIISRNIKVTLVVLFFANRSRELKTVAEMPEVVGMTAHDNSKLWKARTDILYDQFTRISMTSLKPSGRPTTEILHTTVTYPLYILLVFYVATGRSLPSRGWEIGTLISNSGVRGKTSMSSLLNSAPEQPELLLDNPA